jgi:hypothetical protein
MHANKDEIADVALQDVKGVVQEVVKVKENNRELWKVDIKDDKGDEHIFYYDDQGIRATK